MMSDDVETAQTVSYMEELATFDAGERSVVDATRRALEEAGIDQTASPAAIAAAIFWFLKRTIRYVPTPATSALVDQTLIAPSALLAMRNPEGDCPQFSMLAMAMFRNCCIPCLFKTIAAEPAMPEVFGHIYNVIEIAPGHFMPFDSSNGPAPGAEYAAPLKSRVWPRTNPDACKIRNGRKGKLIMMRSTGRKSHGWRNSQLRGALGDVNCDADGNCYDDSSGTYTPAPVLQAPDIPGGYGATTPIDVTALSNAIGQNTSLIAPVTTTSSGSTGFLSTLVNDVTQLASPLVRAAAAKPYYIMGPNGQQVLYNPATGTTSTGIAAVFSSGSAMPWLIGLGLVAAIALSRK